MEDRSTCVEDSVLLVECGIDFVVNRSWCLDIKHEVAESIIRVSHVVVVGIYTTSVEVPVSILFVASLFMCIDGPIHQVEKLLLVVDDLASCWGNVIWHAIVTLNVHKG